VTIVSGFQIADDELKNLAAQLIGFVGLVDR